MPDDKHEPDEPRGTAVSRRDFLKIGAITVTVPAVIGPAVIQVEGQEVAIHGPGKTPITLNINGRQMRAEVEPRVTLLDVLRHHLDLTGAKRVCDRAECGACTVLIDGKAVYACNTLAIDAQGKKITTIEGLTAAGKLHPVQQAFIDNDAQQCGYCTPGFVIASHALLQRHPNPTPQQITRGLGGNLCRCGTYHGIRGAIAQAGGVAAKKGA